MSRAVEIRPRRTLAALAVVSIVLAGFAGQQSTDTELTSYAPDSEVAATFDRIEENFSAGGAQIQVIVDAGEGGNVLAADGREAAAQVEETVRSADVDLADGARGVRPFTVATQAEGRAQAAAAALLSRDADLEAGTARAGLVIVELDPALSDSAAQDASLVVAERLETQVAVDGVDVAPFNSAILNDALQTETEEEMPRLLGLSLLLIVGILFLQFRTFSDVALGFIGLLVTITWMYGIGVLLGPDHLGVVGPFTQMSTIIPVLLIGLGIDYSIHLTARYREERGYGLGPPTAASMSVRTVGGALVLATLTTMIGFLTNVFSPLPPIADFGIFTAAGVLSAFVVMTLMVPAARRVLDARRERRGKATAASLQATGEHVGGLARAMGRTAALAERAPKVSLAVAAVVTLAAMGAGSRIDTSFSQDDFVPADSEPGRLVERIDTLFGGDLNESTYVLVDGDLTDTQTAQGVAGVPGELAGADDVRTQGDRAQVQSPLTVIDGLAQQVPGFADQVAALGYSPGSGVTEDTELAALYDAARDAAPDRMAQVLDDDAGSAVLIVATTAGQERAAGVADTVSSAVEPVRAAGATTTVASEPLVLEETLESLTASQTRGIAITLLAALALLVGYFGFVERKPLLGAITMVPSVAVVGWVLGTMVLLGLSLNVLTAMVASLAIGIGVPFGIHVTNRFMEDRRRYDTVDEAVCQTVTHTGGAMAGSAATTAAGFGVLVFASLAPMQQFGLIVAITITYSLLAAVLIQPSCLKLWAEWRARQGESVELEDHEKREVLEPVS
ncbi:MAG: MMPL family transporter [Acidimicrobiales bacterium]|nr:MMPL family transporter [Acidimicrobiales bacterium]